MIKINIGCGYSLLEGYENLDTHLEHGADKIYKLPEILPYNDNSIDIINCDHVLEDFDNHTMKKIMYMFHRKLKKGGILKLKMPHASCGNFWNSSDHVRPYAYTTLDIYVKSNTHYSKDREVYSSIKAKFNFLSRRHKWTISAKIFYIITLKFLHEYLANKFPAFYELTSWSNRVRCMEIQYILTK